MTSPITSVSSESVASPRTPRFRRLEESLERDEIAYFLDCSFIFSAMNFRASKEPLSPPFLHFSHSQWKCFLIKILIFKKLRVFNQIGGTWIPSFPFLNSNQIGGPWNPIFSFLNFNQIGGPWIPTFPFLNSNQIGGPWIPTFPKLRIIWNNLFLSANPLFFGKKLK